MKLKPARSITGLLRLPGDKSISHRAALIAALAGGRSEISNFSTARDCASTLGCLRALGISIEHNDGKIVFAGSQEGNFNALDASTGRKLWSSNTGANIYGAAATTYMLDGRQWILIPSGTKLIAFALPAN